MDVVGFGENSVDLIATVQTLPPPDGKAALDDLRTSAGGQVATAMIGCARLGLSASYIGSFGADAHGAIAREVLANAGVDLARSRTTSAPTRTALILVETDRQSRIVLSRRDERLNWEPDAIPVDALADAKVLLVDATDLEGAIQMAAAARHAGVITVADVDEDVPGVARLLPLIDVLVVSASFAADVRQLHARSGARVVIATLGADGAVAWDGTNEHYSPGFVVPVVDTTGAGDAFRAGLIAALLNPWTPGPQDQQEPWTVDPVGPWTSVGSWSAVLDFANGCAALNCRSVGAQAGLPTRAEVEALVTSRSVARSKGTWGVHAVSQRRGESLSGEPE